MNANEAVCAGWLSVSNPAAVCAVASHRPAIMPRIQMCTECVSPVTSDMLLLVVLIPARPLLYVTQAGIKQGFVSGAWLLFTGAVEPSSSEWHHVLFRRPVINWGQSRDEALTGTQASAPNPDELRLKR